MNTDNTDSDGPTAKADQRRRYPAPTIDLEATEIPGTPNEASAAPPTGEAWSSPTDQAPENGDRRHPIEEAVARASSGGGGDEPPPKRHPLFSHLPLDPPWQLIGAGAAGAAIALLALAALWGTGALSGDAADGALASRLARIEQQLGRAPERGGQSNSDALATRISSVEATLKSLATDTANLDRRMDDTADAARAARERSDAAARALAQIAQNSASGQRTSGAAPDVTELTARVDALESATKTLQSQVGKTLAKTSDAAADDRALRFALVATTLRLAVERGHSFAPELAQAKRFTGDSAQLAVLEPFADQGVPTPASLARDLSLLTPALLRAAEAPNADNGFLSRLQANAEHLVRIRPLEETPGDEPATVISRIELRSAHGDIPGAIAEFGKLPDAVRAPAESWIKKAQAREDALEAARKISADALAALAATAG
jgi:hypothetical protein